jgi:16S rRNA (cytidine1402-2'-O)-methyltransferase
MEKPIGSLQFGLLNEHATQQEAEELMQPLINGINVGLMSEAGVPAVADPGSKVVALAHKKGIQVVPLTGPSSIIMAVMGSGLNGQNFAFVGYVPVKSPEREKRIRQLEQRSREEQQTQFLIEAPYRNNQLLHSLLVTLQPSTLLSIACDLTLPTEFVFTHNVNQWKKQMPDLNKRPSIFGIQW